MDKEDAYILLIYLAVLIAFLWAIFNAVVILSVKLINPQDAMNMDDQENITFIPENKLKLMLEIGEKISKGADAFLIQEYCIMAIFIILFGVVVLLVVDIFPDGEAKAKFYASVAYVIGAITSMICGILSMKIAVSTNYRTTFKAINSLEEAFKIAYRGGVVIGFTTIGLGLGVLLSIILIYKRIFNPVVDINDSRSYSLLMNFIAAYGLGASTMALFARVSGGIYTKAADVGADLVGKIDHDLEEDSPRNPATIADNVGDNVVYIAGMGADLFCSFASSTCASLVLIASTSDLMSQDKAALYFPLLVAAGGICACFIASYFGIYMYRVRDIRKIGISLSLQLLIASVFCIIVIVGCVHSLPYEWKYVSPTNFQFIYETDGGKLQYGNRWFAYISTIIGLITGLLIGFTTDYFTSNHWKPVREIALSCTSGAALNIIYGLSLGYLSTIIPIILLAITILVSIELIGLMGVAFAAIGMLSTLSISLAVDAYGPISDNAGGIAEMANLGAIVRERTDALDAAGNTTAAVGKGYAIGSAVLVGFGLYGAFVTRARLPGGNERISDISVTNPWVFSIMLIGGMIPYAFAALTMKSVGMAAQEMVEEVRRQFQDPDIKHGLKEPDYKRCIQISTQASLREMILPGLLVLLTPLFWGFIFHPVCVAGLLPGILVSGVQLAISMSNSGEAWDKCKKHIEKGYYNRNGEFKGKGSDEHKAAVIGDTVGDPLKDTSGPSINILIKLTAILALVFCNVFKNTSWLAGPFKIK
jgi:H(+)-translocating pyrophosphatase